MSVSKKKKNKTKRESDTEPDLMIETPKAPLSVYNVPATVPATVDVPTAELEISTVEPVPATVDVPTAELEISTVEPVPATVDVPVTAELEISTVELEIPKEEPEVPQPQVQRPKKHISAKAKIQVFFMIITYRYKVSVLYLIVWCRHSVVTHIGYVTRDQRVPGSTPVRVASE